MAEIPEFPEASISDWPLLPRKLSLLLDGGQPPIAQSRRLGADGHIVGITEPFAESPDLICALPGMPIP